MKYIDICTQGAFSSKSICAYMQAPSIQNLVELCSQSSIEAYKAFVKASQSEQNNGVRKARCYQKPIMCQEQKRERLAVALRQNGERLVSDAERLVMERNSHLGEKRDESAFSALIAVLTLAVSSLMRKKILQKITSNHLLP